MLNKNFSTHLTWFWVLTIMLTACIGRTIQTDVPMTLATAVMTPIPTLVVISSMTAIPSATPISTASSTSAPLMSTATPLPITSVHPYECPIELVGSVSTPLSRERPLRVAFIDNNGIQIWEEMDKTTQMILEAEDIIALNISDDGQIIAFLRSVNEEGVALWAVDNDGKNAHELISTSTFRAFDNRPGDLTTRPLHLVWIPDSHVLAFSTISYDLIDGVIEGITAHSHDDLRLIDVDTGVQTTLLPPGNGGNFTYSPDGQQIALVTDTSLNLLNADGSDWRQDILTYPALGITDSYYRPVPAWAADASSLFIATTNAIDNTDAFYNPEASSTIWQVDVNGSPPKKVATMIGAPLDPIFSPDNSQVAFTNWPLDELHIAAIDNAWNIVYEINEGIYLQNWLPDSSGFVFRSFREAPQIGRLCQKSNLLPLPDTPDTFVRHIEWIDHSRFLFTIDERAELYLGDLDGSYELISALHNMDKYEYFQRIGSFAVYDYSLSGEVQ